MIIKAGDNCRQELLALQMTRAFAKIYADSGLPLWLRAFNVIATSTTTAFIEAVTDAPSIHAVKSRAPRDTSLRAHFEAKFGKSGTPGFRTAQRNFVESLAGYSVLTYILQVKDRHNGNILLHDDGHLIHIDFNFMLSTSPGGINFESAPFKLTREYLEVMDSDDTGMASEAFNYYKVLCIQGYLAVRKHAERIITLVEMMSASGCPCFKAGPKVLSNLRRRFNLGNDGGAVRGDHAVHGLGLDGRVVHAAVRLLPEGAERDFVAKARRIRLRRRERRERTAQVQVLCTRNTVTLFESRTRTSTSTVKTAPSRLVCFQVYAIDRSSPGHNSRRRLWADPRGLLALALAAEQSKGIR